MSRGRLFRNPGKSVARDRGTASDEGKRVEHQIFHQRHRRVHDAEGDSALRQCLGGLLVPIVEELWCQTLEIPLREDQVPVGVTNLEGLRAKVRSVELQ